MSRLAKFFDRSARAVARAAEEYGAPGEAFVEKTRLADEIEEIKHELKVAERRLETATAQVEAAKISDARSLAYYDLVVSLEKQRDTWKEMFLRQSTENANAQGYLVSELEKAGALLNAIVRVLNHERKERDLPAFEATKIASGAEVKKGFDELLAELQAAAPEDIDGQAARAKIKAEHGHPGEP